MDNLNYGFNATTRKSYVPNVSPIFKQVDKPDGSISVIEADKHESPFEGMSADSFTLDAQLKAGVRLMPSPKNENVSINHVDNIVNDVNKVIDANKNGVKLNTKSSKL